MRNQGGVNQKKYVLVNTDKTKRIMAISEKDYFEAGEQFLDDKKNYKLLPKDNSKKIEQKANDLIKRIKLNRGFDKLDIEKLLVSGSRPANFFINLKDHKNVDKDGKMLIRPIASVHGTPVDKVDFILQSIFKQVLNKVPTNITSNRELGNDIYLLNKILNNQYDTDCENMLRIIFGRDGVDDTSQHIPIKYCYRLIESIKENLLHNEIPEGSDSTSRERTFGDTDSTLTQINGHTNSNEELLGNQGDFELCGLWKNADIGIISLDVVNLYPSIPIWEGINLIMTFLNETKDINWMGISKQLFKDMLYLVCYQYEIRFNNKIYLQKKGVPMGARFAPPFAIIVLYMLEREILKRQEGILFYKRYIDDTLIFFDKNKVTAEQVLDKFNSANSNIVFTMENPNPEGFLAFLDMELKMEGRAITHRWYQKGIHSGNLIHKDSATLFATKMNIITNMFMTAILNSNTLENIKTSINKLYKLIIHNGYQINEINNCIEKSIIKVNEMHKINKQNKMWDNMTCFLKVPGISQNLFDYSKKLFKSYNLGGVQIISTKNDKLSDILKPKNDYVVACKPDCEVRKWTPNCNIKNVVYKFTCKICNGQYIGMTNNCVCLRVKQHKSNLINKDERNPLVDHIKNKHNNVLPDISVYEFDIIKKCNNNKLTTIYESKLIEKLNPIINRKFERVNYKFV